MILSHLPFSLTPPPSLNPNPYPTSLRPRLLFQCHCRPEWGTNAESVRPGWFGPKGSRSNRGVEEEEEEKREAFDKEEKRKWWSDYSNDGYDSLDDDFDWFDDDEDESILDKFWILKVLKSYGIFLPAIIGSMLLATGPKAFLMALALPLGQSAISILFENIWGKKEREKPRPRRKRRGPFSGPKRGGFNRKEEREENNNYKRKDYRSWVSMGNGDSYSGSQRSGLGGWDELDKDYETDGPVRKLSKKRKYKEVPLFMRLLVAVFPFLGSWFRIL
ncbi:hypothetical protein LUZ63_014628 [Rhynchospora breviuscula]|uniref:Uncharacterized protein n=1 Tax=Rhynchospora breviuscula TaxID=2022672 RepID=A0A9Q0CAU4_9POAL|nr:hypothetical protein LUZ63_014628 [Rhynchospora breviuscula]